MMDTEIILTETIQHKIYLIRCQKIILSSDLAVFYQVKTKELNKAVVRNIERFPEDFMFQLTIEELRELEKKLGIIREHGGSRVRPYAFTEQGIAMLSAVLKSERAIIVSVQIMRSFMKLRQLLLSNEALTEKLKAIETRTDEHAKVIIQIIEELQKPKIPKSRRIGF
ncbi:MAG: ORF6N domain-containing protein [Proteobacteria bacterium]|nr:ORF6N domain-containing protein [Pseudomonadota bacterium]